MLTPIHILYQLRGLIKVDGRSAPEPKDCDLGNNSHPEGREERNNLRSAVTGTTEGEDEYPMNSASVNVGFTYLIGKSADK